MGVEGKIGGCFQLTMNVDTIKGYGTVRGEFTSNIDKNIPPVLKCCTKVVYERDMEQPQYVNLVIIS